mgnify:CR=1 FL=1
MRKKIEKSDTRLPNTFRQMLAMTFGYTDKPEAASYASDMVLVAIGLTLSAVARYRMLLVVTYIAERISEKTKA